MSSAPDSVDFQNVGAEDSPPTPPPAETLDDVDNTIVVPEVSTNVQKLADPSDTLLLDDTKSPKDEQQEENPSPIIGFHSGNSLRRWSSRWSGPWSSSENVKPLSSYSLTKRPSSSSPDRLDEKPSPVGAGLSNLGNTCFLNAVVQCFTHTVTLVQGLRSYDHHTVPCDSNINGFCVLCAFRDHVEISLACAEKFISPWKFVNNLSYFSSSFQRYQQEDAHEFLQCFLDRLESTCSDSKSKKMISGAMDDNFVKQAFGGRVVSKLKCCNCGHFSDTYEPSIDLSLEIEDVTTLQSALESFTKLEKIEDPDTRFTCENCKEEVAIEKQLILEETPSVAAFHLKRFKNDGSYVEKIDKFVEFPLELDLKPYTRSSHESDVELKYYLYAIVVHIGFSATSGHYYSFIRSGTDVWYKFDDAKVVRVQEDYVLTQDAYILFYAKQGTPWFSGYLESIKPFLDPRSSSTSPKSVLDNVDMCTSSPKHATNLNNVVIEISHTADETLVESTSGSRHNHADGIKCNDDTHRMSTTLPFGASDDKRVDGGKDKDGACRKGTTILPGTSAPIADTSNATKVFSPSVLKESSLNQYEIRTGANSPQTPRRSSSPDIYRDESPEPELYIKPNHQKLVNQVSCRKQLKKEVESSETKEARRLLKTLPSGRGKSLLAAMAGPYSEDSQRNKRRKRMVVTPNKDDSPSTSHRKAGLRELARPLAAGSFR